MTPTQFQTFLQQLDASLKQISTEVEQEQMDLSTQLFIKAILMKLRVAFGTIGKQILSQEPMGAQAKRSASEAEPQPFCPACKHTLSKHVKRHGKFSCMAKKIDASGNWEGCGCDVEPKFPQPMAPADSSSTGSVEGSLPSRRNSPPTAPLLDNRAGVGEFIAPAHVENDWRKYELTPTDLYYHNEEWLREAFA